MKKKTLDELSIYDFYQIIPWENIKETMKAKDYKKFEKWMRGQTTAYNGVYPGDLNSFLKHGHEKAPVYD